MGKIIFYEDEDFCGHHFECTDDCMDLLCHFNRCHSIKVESGRFMIYEKTGYTGNQYYLKKGEYPDLAWLINQTESAVSPDYHCWMGVNDSISSCRHIPMEPGPFNLCLYQRIEFGGKIMDLGEEDCPCVMDRFNIDNIFSCNVRDGNWIFYENPNYQGRMYWIRPGEYIRFSEWGGRTARVGSIRRIVDY